MTPVILLKQWPCCLIFIGLQGVEFLTWKGVRNHLFDPFLFFTSISASEHFSAHLQQNESLGFLYLPLPNPIFYRGGITPRHSSGTQICALSPKLSWPLCSSLGPWLCGILFFSFLKYIFWDVTLWWPLFLPSDLSGSHRQPRTCSLVSLKDSSFPSYQPLSGKGCLLFCYSSGPPNLLLSNH